MPSQELRISPDPSQLVPAGAVSQNRRDFFISGGRLVAGAVAGGGLLNLLACTDPAGELTGLLSPVPPNYATITLSPDPSGDDTSAINYALYSAGVGGTVKLNPGTYKFNQGHLGFYNNQSVLKHRTLRSAVASNKAILRTTYIPSTLQPGSWDWTKTGCSIGIGDYGVILDLRIEGPGYWAATHAAGIDSGNANEWLVRGCHIQGFTNGLNTGNNCIGVEIYDTVSVSNQFTGFQVGYESHYAAIKDCVAAYNGANGIDINAEYCSIERNDCSYNGLKPGSDRNGIFVASGDSPYKAGAWVAHNTCNYNKRAGIMVAAATGGVATARVYNNTCRYNDAAGAIVEGQGTGGIQNIQVDYNVLQNNHWAFVQNGSSFSGTNKLENNNLCGNTKSACIYPPLWSIAGNSCYSVQC